MRVQSFHRWQSSLIGDVLRSRPSRSSNIHVVFAPLRRRTHCQSRTMTVPTSPRNSLKRSHADKGKAGAVREYAHELQPNIPDHGPDDAQKTEHPAHEEAAPHSSLAAAVRKRQCREDEREAEEHIPREQFQRVRGRPPDKARGSKAASAAPPMPHSSLLLTSRCCDVILDRVEVETQGRNTHQSEATRGPAPAPQVPRSHEGGPPDHENQPALRRSECVRERHNCF